MITCYCGFWTDLPVDTKLNSKLLTLFFSGNWDKASN